MKFTLATVVLVDIDIALTRCRSHFSSVVNTFSGEEIIGKTILDDRLSCGAAGFDLHAIDGKQASAPGVVEA